MDREEILRRKREYNRQYRARLREGIQKKIESKTDFRWEGLRVIVGTFDKHNPSTVYYEGTINLEGSDYENKYGKQIKKQLEDLFRGWMREQEVYKDNYILIVDTLTMDEHSDYTAKNKHIKFDLTLVHRNSINWTEAKAYAKQELDKLYVGIAEIITGYGVRLKRRLPTWGPKAAKPQTS